MKKYRLSTTISPKHWSLLKKYSEKFETQQKALEHALESLDDRSLASNLLSEEDKVWYRISKDIRMTKVLIQTDYFMMLLKTADIEPFKEYVAVHQPVAFAIEYYYRKPLKECSLREVLDCILLNSRIMNIADNIDYKDKGDYYELIIIHSFGINMSKMHLIAHENAFGSYGVKFDCNYSERHVFFKIYKSDNAIGTPGKSQAIAAVKPAAK